MKLFWTSQCPLPGSDQSQVPFATAAQKSVPLTTNEPERYSEPTPVYLTRPPTSTRALPSMKTVPLSVSVFGVADGFHVISPKPFLHVYDCAGVRLMRPALLFR